MNWPVCPLCGLCGSVMNDFVSQRYDVGKRVQFKMLLGQCRVCSDVYHREREFLVYAAEELYPTDYTPPVNSEERICLEDFLKFFLTEPESDRSVLRSYKECFGPSGDIGPVKSLPYLSDFPRAALGLVTRERILPSLGRLTSRDRTVVLLYLMGIRSWSRLAEELEATESTVQETFFHARRELQNLVCRA